MSLNFLFCQIELDIKTRSPLQLMVIIALLFLVILLPISGFMVYRKIRRKMNEQLLRDALNGKRPKAKNIQ